METKEEYACQLFTPTNSELTRNSVLASWDAEEYGMIGSTEWVEEYTNWLTETAVAYLNIDVAVSGPRPGLDATPELHTIALEIFEKVIHPNFGAFNISLYDAWNAVSEGTIGVLGSGSDFTAFLHRGISSVGDMKSSRFFMIGQLTSFSSSILAQVVAQQIPSGTTTPTTTPTTGCPISATRAFTSTPPWVNSSLSSPTTSPPTPSSLLTSPTTA